MKKLVENWRKFGSEDAMHHEPEDDNLNDEGRARNDAKARLRGMIKEISATEDDLRKVGLDQQADMARHIWKALGELHRELLS